MVEKYNLHTYEELLMTRIGKAFEALSERIDEDIVLDTIDELLSDVSYVSGDQYQNLAGSFELHFQGNIFHLFKVVKKVLEVNYSDFLSGLTGVLGKAKALIPKGTTGLNI